MRWVLVLGLRGMGIGGVRVLFFHRYFPFVPSTLPTLPEVVLFRCSCTFALIFSLRSGTLPFAHPFFALCTFEIRSCHVFGALLAVRGLSKFSVRGVFRYFLKGILDFFYSIVTGLRSYVSISCVYV